MSVMTDNVFSMEVLRRRDEGMTYGQMEAKTRETGGKEGTLSSAWWNKVAIGEMPPPPEPKYIAGIATVLELPERHVRHLICDQWYGVSLVGERNEYVRALVDQGVDNLVSWLRGRVASPRANRGPAATKAEG
jgi:hypothetical protein